MFYVDIYISLIKKFNIVFIVFFSQLDTWEKKYPATNDLKGITYYPSFWLSYEIFYVSCRRLPEHRHKINRVLKVHLKVSNNI